jgi:hypothetical protein
VVDRQQRQQSPVEVINKIREEPGDFRRTSSSGARLVEAYRAEALAALRRILLEPSVDAGSNSDGFSVIDHLRERRVIHTWSKQTLARHREPHERRRSFSMNTTSIDDATSNTTSIDLPATECALITHNDMEDLEFKFPNLEHQGSKNGDTEETSAFPS